MGLVHVLVSLGGTTSVSSPPVVVSRVEADPRPLVLTWLHDEGDRCEAVELCRDVLLSAQWTEESIWRSLLSHMHLNSQHRVFLQTVLMLPSLSLTLFSRLCIAPAGYRRISTCSHQIPQYFGADLVQILNIFTTESLDKFSQVIFCSCLS